MAIVDFEGSAEVGATAYPNVDVYRTSTWAQSSGVLDALINQKHDYKTVILDPINALQVQLKDEIIRRQAQTQPGAKSNNSMGDRSMLLSDWDVIWTRIRKILELTAPSRPSSPHTRTRARTAWATWSWSR